MSGKCKNILFITIDQWRFDFLGANGFDYIKTPNLDKLAAKSSLFLQHRSVTAPCGPARNSLLTGLYQHSHRQIWNGTPTIAPSTNFPLELRKNGILPILMGYTDQMPILNANMTQKDPVFRTMSGVMAGFEQRLAFDDNYYLWIAQLKKRGIINSKTELDAFLPDADSVKKSPKKFYSRHHAIYPKELSPVAFVADAAIDFLSAAHNKDPFCLHLTILHPHPPYIAPKPYHNMYQAKNMPKPIRASLEKEYAVCKWTASHNKITPNQWMMQGFKGNIRDMSSSEVQELRATYAGLVSEVDDNIGRIMACLTEQGLDKNTLIVITADHGDMLGDHYFQGKLGYWDQSYHIPLIIHNPLLQASWGQKIAKFTESVDIMPTILDFMDIPIPRQCQGASLRDLMIGNEPKRWREYTFTDFHCADAQKTEVFDDMGENVENASMNVIQNHEFKLVHSSFDEPLLFQISKDPHCYKNLAKNPKYFGVLSKLYQELMNFRNHCENREYSHLIGGRKGELFVGDKDKINAIRPC